MLSGIAVCSPRLSRNTYLHGVGLGFAGVQLQSGTRWVPVVLTARTGVFKVSARGWTATAEFDSVGPSRARTWFCPISVWAFALEVAWSEASSSKDRSIVAPLTPPDEIVVIVQLNQPAVVATPSGGSATAECRAWGADTADSPPGASRPGS